MKVSETMSRRVQLASPHDRISDAARTMDAMDVGAIPVGENDRLVGMITDRDIAIRAVGQNRGPDTPVREIMTRDVQYCFEDDDIEEVCAKMAYQQVRRLPVINRGKRLVGIRSLCDLASSEAANYAAQALGAISQPGGAHTQSGSQTRPH